MSAAFPITLAPRILLRPREVFARIAANQPGAGAVFFQYALWLGLAPPLSAFVGARMFGWLAGAEPLTVSSALMLQVSIAYYILLLCGFVFAGLFLRWMLPTYSDSDGVAAAGDSDSGSDNTVTNKTANTTGVCFALVAAAGTPLMAGGVAHLYPSLAFNMAVFIPAFLWSVFLFYRGVPVALNTGAERGMLLTCSMVGALLVMVAGFLGIITLLWVNGFGPPLGI